MRYARVYLGTVATNKICTRVLRSSSTSTRHSKQRRPCYFIRGYAAPVHSRGIAHEPRVIMYIILKQEVPPTRRNAERSLLQIFFTSTAVVMQKNSQLHGHFSPHSTRSKENGSFVNAKNSL